MLPPNKQPWKGPVVRCGAAEEIGSRACLEDANLTVDDLAPGQGLDTPCAFYASVGNPIVQHIPERRGKAEPDGTCVKVFDGHGGRDAAVYCRDHLVTAVTSQDGWQSDVPAALRTGFLHTDELLRTGGAPGSCGTTALAALVLGRTLFVANTGDSRAVLCRRGRSIELSTDHKPPAEAERIASAGGFVDSEGYLNGCVSVSRALGDWQLCCANKLPLKTHPENGHPAGPLTAEPDVRVHALTEEDEFVILACDGLWDVLSSQGAVELARQVLRQHNDPARLAAELAKEALRRHSGDNVTCVVVCFSPQPPPCRPPPLAGRPGSRIFQRSISQETLADLQRHLNGGVGEGGCT